MQLTVGDASQLLKVSESTIYRWIKQEGMPARRIGDQIRFNDADLFEWATRKNLAVSPELFSRGERMRTSVPDVTAAMA
jgi:nitrogen PTS system EIIA component